MTPPRKPRNLSPGEIIHLTFEHNAHHDTAGSRYALVVSEADFNKSGRALVCPITQGQANQRDTHGTWFVSLMNAGTSVQGIVLTNQVKSIDWRARDVTTNGELVDPRTLQEVRDILAAILGI